MKKRSLIFCIYVLIAACYAVISLILMANKNSVFWTGLGFAVFSVAAMAAITALSAKKSAAFSVEVSMVTFSGLYVVAVIVVNILCGFVLQANIAVFVSIQLICLAVFGVITLLMFLAKSHIAGQNSALQEKVSEIQGLLAEFERIRNKLTGLNNEAQKDATDLLDGVIEELRFSDVDVSADVSDIDRKLKAKTRSLSAEVDTLITDQSQDLSHRATLVNDIKDTIKDRDLQIRLTSSNI